MDTTSKVSGDAWTEAQLWLATLSKRQEIRENEGAMALELDLISEALHVSGARTASRVRAIFHHLKADRGLTFWPSAKDIKDAAKTLAHGGDGPSVSKSGDRDRLSFDEHTILTDRVLPMARKWVSEHPERHPLHQHGMQTLEYWGEKV